MINYNVTTAILGISTVLSILYLIRKHSIYIRYIFWWISVCAAILFLTIFPKISDQIVHIIGVTYPPTFFFFGAILMLFVKILFMDIDRSKNEVRIRRLIQRLGMLEIELEKERSTYIRKN